MRQQREILGVIDLESSGDHQGQHEELDGIDRDGLFSRHGHAPPTNRRGDPKNCVDGSLPERSPIIFVQFVLDWVILCAAQTAARASADSRLDLSVTKESA